MHCGSDLGLLLSTARRVVEGDALVRSGRLDRVESHATLGADVSGKTLGIIGMGGSGKAVGHRAVGFRSGALSHTPIHGHLITPSEWNTDRCKDCSGKPMS